MNLNCDENPEKVAKRFDSVEDNIKEFMDEEGIQPQTGDCANFAHSLRNVVGGEVWCSFENQNAFLHGEPAHCALKCEDKFIDADGETSYEALEARAMPPLEKNQDLDQVKKDIVVDEVLRGMCTIEDGRKIKKLEKNIQNQIDCQHKSQMEDTRH